MCSLEAQALEPLKALEENARLDEIQSNVLFLLVVSRSNAIAEDRGLFAGAFDDSRP